ncbi:Bursicon [Aphelenchoides besseyi]|nr:Bursicon [Aphelenchoides besseyi]
MPTRSSAAIGVYQLEQDPPQLSNDSQQLSKSSPRAMKILSCIFTVFVFILTVYFLVDARAINSSEVKTTTRESTTIPRDSVEIAANSNAVRYLIADSDRPSERSHNSTAIGIREQVVESRTIKTIVNDESADESGDEDERSNETTEDRASFMKLSRQAFMQLDHGDEFIRPAVQADEQRRLQWLDDHQRHKDEREGSSDSLPEHKDVLTLTNGDNLAHRQTCTGDLFKHKIRMSGCEPKIIINRYGNSQSRGRNGDCRFCHGSCSSFYVPKLRSKKLKATFRSCAACVPVETDYVKVQLNCPDRPEGTMQRTVVRVKRCACRNIQFDTEEEEEF